MVDKQDDGLLALIDQLPEELQEEGSTGRDLIDNIIYEAKKQEREGIIRDFEPEEEGLSSAFISDGKTVLNKILARNLRKKWQALKGG